MESISPKDAKVMAESGDWVLVDVRPANKFEAAHPEGAVNVQLFKKVPLHTCAVITVVQSCPRSAV